MSTEISKEHAEEFTQSLGQMGEGWFRQVALGVKMNIPKALGRTREEWCGGFKVAMRNGADRLEAEREMIEADPDISKRAMADILGVAESTVREDLSARNRADNELAQEEKEDLSARNRAPQEDAFPPEKVEQINHWAAARNMVDILDLFDGPIDRAREVAEYVNTQLESKHRKKVTPARARHGAEFLIAFAGALEDTKK